MLYPTSTLDKVLVICLGALIIVSVAFGGLWWYRGTVIDKQTATIATQQATIAAFEKDKAAQEVADKQLQADKDRIAKERDKYKTGMDNALKDNECANAPLPDDAQRLLNQLYGKQGA